MSKKELYFGIDLGTTNSAISVMINNVPRIIKLDTGKTTLPSCVKFDGTSFTVGDLAYKERYKSNTIYSVKRLMGTDTKITLSGKEFTPVEISAEILRELKRQAEIEYGEGNVNKVTITVPAYFTDNQKKDTQKAGALAGLDVVRIINEPTSASLAYSMGDLKESENILVFDLGGGTFDVNLIKMVKSSNIDFPLLDLALEDEEDTDDISVKILSTDGDAKLGGDDFDRSLFSTVLRHLEIKPTSLTKEETEVAILKLEQIKKKGVKDNNPIRIQGKVLAVSEDIFREAFKPVWDKALAVTKSCIQSSPEKRFNKIVLVGGSTKIPFVTEYLKREFPNCVIYNGLNPDESVALGASVQTWLSSGGSKSMSVFDVVPLPIGLAVTKTINNKLVPDRFEAFIYKDTPIPVKVKKNLEVTVRENSTGFSVNVYQGFSPNALNNTLLGTIDAQYSNSEKPGDVLQIECELGVDVNGVLNLEVKTPHSKAKATFKSVMGASSLASEASPREGGEAARTNQPTTLLSTLSPINRKKYEKWKDNALLWDLTDEERSDLSDLIERWVSSDCPKDLADQIISISRVYSQRNMKQNETNFFGSVM